ncbi:hypothetical protein AHF37_09275 [Paragonimus kellicotti]|nr:hypothetical protein AHF37_09275 [Paragonimus kellicotti]
MQGERTDEDSNLLEETVRRLTDDLEERSKMASLLNSQLSNLRAAQDKETLQRKGDQLDAETRQAEQELIALENTLAVMNGCNSVYRLGKSKLSEDSEELRMERDLKEQISVLSIKLRYDGIHLNELKETEATMLETRKRLDTDLEVYNQQKHELSIELNKKTRELNNQNERRDRAGRRWERVQSAVASMPTLTTEQRGQIYNDIKVRMMKELIDQVTRELLARIKSDGSMVEQAHAMLSASGVPFSTLGQSRQVSRMSISPLGGSTSSSTSLSGSGATSHASSARSTLEDADQSVHQSTDRHKQSTPVSFAAQQRRFRPKPISAVDLGQQTILPGETRLASGTDTRRSTAGEKSSTSSGSTSSKK